MRTTLLALILLGCDPMEIDTGDKNPDTGESDTDADTDADGDTDQGDAPYVEEADAYCLFNDSSEQYYYWIVNCKADDPQGDDTLADFGDEWEHTVSVRLVDTDVASYPLICDDDGDCTGTFYESDHGVACASASNYIFAFVVYDQDGNASEPFEVVGREGQ